MPRSPLYLAFLAGALLCAPARAQTPADTGAAATDASAGAGQAAQAGQAETAGPPPVFEIASRASMVVDSAGQAERQVARLGNASQAASDLTEARRRYADLAALLDVLVEADYVRPERVSRVRDQVLLEDQRLEAAQGRVTDRLTELGELRMRWLERQRAWQRWRAALRGEPDYGLVEGDVGRSLARIDTVTRAVDAAMTNLLALQLDSGCMTSSAEVARRRTGGERQKLQHFVRPPPALPRGGDDSDEVPPQQPVADRHVMSGNPLHPRFCCRRAAECWNCTTTAGPALGLRACRAAGHVDGAVTRQGCGTADPAGTRAATGARVPRAVAPVSGSAPAAAAPARRGPPRWQ